MIFNIQRFSTHDGKGIRTIIFFKGCPLRCQWCSNPEGQKLEHEIFFEPRKCIFCLDCTKKSKNNEFTFENGKIVLDREAVKDACIFDDVCPTKAIEVIGKEQGVDEILEQILKDQPFYNNSGGGVTISGGEPFFQPEFLEALCKELKKLDIHTSVETCLNVPWSNVKRSVQYIDEFLADLKHTDSVKLKKYTGGNINLILTNLKELEAAKANVIIRIPVIPGFNDTISEMTSILDYVAGLTNVREVNFLPYHKLGTNKYNLLGRDYIFHSVSVKDDLIQQFIKYAKNKGLISNIGG